MKSAMPLPFILLVALVTLSHGAYAAKVTVYAASSMTNAVEALGQSFSEQTGIKVINVFAGSSALARQIAYGAPADVFISANQRWVDYLQTKNAAVKTAVYPLATNRLVVVTNRSNRNIAGMDIKDIEINNADIWRQFGKLGRIAMGNVSSVPAGIYSHQALQKMGIWSVIKNNTAQMNNVRQVLSLVERNEVPIGIVYHTDAIASKKVSVIKSIPDNKHDKIVYPLMMIKDNDASRSYQAFILSSQGQKILSSFGFNPINTANPLNRQ